MKCIRSDNGTEFAGKGYQTFWRTLFDMAKCMLIESGLPKQLWTYAVQTAAVVRNRGFNKTTRRHHRKLDPRCEKCVFIGYDKNSPAYIVYFPVIKKVQKHRLVKFVAKSGVERQTQTSFTPEDDDFIQHRSRSPAHRVLEQEPEGSHHQPQTVEVKCEPGSSRYPSRERRRPDRYTDCNVSKCMSEEEADQVQSNIDYCYRVTEGKKAVGGRWVYAIKPNVDGSEKYKARYVAKGYSQKIGVD